MRAKKKERNKARINAKKESKKARRKAGMKPSKKVNYLESQEAKMQECKTGIKESW